MTPTGFAVPHMLWLLVIVPIGIAVYLFANYRRRKSALRFAATPMLASVLPRSSAWARHLVAGGFLAALTALLIAAAQPTGLVTTPREQATIVLAVDVSYSMQAEDVAPSRLAGAKAAARTFIEAVPDTLNVGLVVFAGTANVVVPPTQSHDQVLTALDRVQLAESTAIGEAIFASLQAAQMVATDPDQGDIPRRIVVLSDGKTTIGRPDALAAQAAKTAKIPVDTVALGTRSGTVTIQGETIPVPVSESDLKAVATATGGTFFAAKSLTDVTDIYSQIGSSIGYEKTELPIGHRWTLLGVGLLLLALLTSWLWLGRLS